jgi:hypothetical protein
MIRRFLLARSHASGSLLLAGAALCQTRQLEYCQWPVYASGQSWPGLASRTQDESGASGVTVSHCLSVAEPGRLNFDLNPDVSLRRQCRMRRSERLAWTRDKRFCPLAMARRVTKCGLPMCSSWF